MIGVVVTFEGADKFDPAVVAKIADEASGMFQGMPGLRNKVFTLDEDRGRVRNFYVWESEDAARGFFNERLTELVTGLYGVRPTIEFVEIVGMVDNS